MRKVPAFSVIEKESGAVLAMLPRTMPIGETVEAYERAGFVVTWSWSEIETDTVSSLMVVTA